MTSSTRLFTRFLSSTRYVRPNPSRPPPAATSPQSPSAPSLTNRIFAHLDLRTTRTTFIILLKFFFALHLLTQHIGYITITTGPSMLPTLSVNGDGVLLARYYRRGRGIKVGDVVAFTHPLEPEAGVIKRVVGMPGDFVCTGVRVRGEEGMIQVPQGHCWIVGDNLPESRDSRYYGPLPLALIDAKAVARVWPLSEMGWLRNTLQPPNKEL